MGGKKQTESLYTLADLAAEAGIKISEALPGFSVGSTTSDISSTRLNTYFRSDFLATMLVTSGDMTLSINMKQYTVRKNNLVILSPSSIKQLVHITPDATMLAVGFTTDFLSKIGLPAKMPELAGYYSSQFLPIWQLTGGDAALFSTIARHLDRRGKAYEQPFGRELFTHTFHIYMYEMARMSERYVQLAPGQLSRKENLLIQFISLVQRNFKTQRSVKTYAAQLNITPKYLTETVKEMSGKTAGEIIDDHVLLEAKLYLDNPDYSIAQIADALNFADQSFFGKFFKRFTGLSPKEYRQSL